MASNKDNLIFEQTSFLHGNNSPFIKDLYLKYLSNPKSIPESWAQFFNGLNDDQEIIKKEILGPSWSPKKNNNQKINFLQKETTMEKRGQDNEVAPITTTSEKEREQSVKAIALIRAIQSAPISKAILKSILS